MLFGSKSLILLQTHKSHTRSLISSHSQRGNRRYQNQHVIPSNCACVWNAICIPHRATLQAHPPKSILTPSISPYTSIYRWNTVKHPRNLIRGHHIIRHTPDQTAGPQFIESDGHFPALGVVDDEDVFAAVCVADRGAQNMAGCFLALTSLFYVNSFLSRGCRGFNIPRHSSWSTP
jgi:hypothetical protein